ncbi:hypothetical protein D9M71_801440 [compost metagenome]
MTSFGVPAGATRPNQAVTTMSFTPASAMVGTSGSSARRLSLVTASARSLPDWMYGMELGRLSIMKVNCWPSNAATAGPAPL